MRIDIMKPRMARQMHSSTNVGRVRFGPSGPRHSLSMDKVRRSLDSYSSGSGCRERSVGSGASSIGSTSAGDEIIIPRGGGVRILRRADIIDGLTLQAPSDL